MTGPTAGVEDGPPDPWSVAGVGGRVRAHAAGMITSHQHPNAVHDLHGCESSFGLDTCLNNAFQSPVGADASPANPHDRALRWVVARRRKLGRLPLWILPACAVAIAAVPTPVSGGEVCLKLAGQLAFFGDLADSADAKAFTTLLAPFGKTEGWFTPNRPSGAGGGSGLPKPLYSRGGDLEPPPGQRRCRYCRLPLEGLPDQAPRPTKGHATGQARVRPSLSDPCPDRRVPPYSILRPAGECRPQGQHHQDPRPAAVATCASSKSSAAARNRCRAHRHGSKPHDAPPAILKRPPPAVEERPQYLRAWLGRR